MQLIDSLLSITRFCRFNSVFVKLKCSVGNCRMSGADGSRPHGFDVALRLERYVNRDCNTLLASPPRRIDHVHVLSRYVIFWSGIDDYGICPAGQVSECEYAV